MELLTIANVNKLRVQQIALNDWQDMPDGTFKPSLGSSLQFFKDLLKIFFKRILGKYKKNNLDLSTSLLTKQGSLC